MVTIKNSPKLYTPAYNSAVFIVDSSNKSECKFRYIADLYVSGSFVVRKYLFPFGESGYAAFDFSRELQDFVSFDVHENLVGFTTNDNSIVSYQVKFGEEYDNSLSCDEGVDQYEDLTVSSTFYAWNGALQYEEFQSYDHEDYLAGDTDRKFLTNMPNGARIRFDEKFVVNFLQVSGSGVSKIQIKTYGKTGSLIQTCEIASPYETISQVNQRMVSVAVGPDQLNASTLSTGTQPVIHDNVYSYTIQLFKSFAAYSEIKTFKLDNYCYGYDIKRLMFLNRLGGFDQFSFKKRSDTSTDISRTEFTKKLGSVTVNSPSASYGYNIGDRGRTTTSVEANDTFSYNSDWLTQEESAWIKELFTSPEIYECKGDRVSYDINGGLCSLAGQYEITAASYNGGIARLSVVDGGVQIPDGSVFSYIIDDGSGIGMPAFGSGKTITSYAGTGLYDTDIVASINASISVVGTLTLSASGAYVKIILPTTVPIGTLFFFELDNPDCLDTYQKGQAYKITGYDGTYHWTNIPCNLVGSCSLTGKIYLYNFDMSVFPVIGLDSSFEERTKRNSKSIKHTIRIASANKINIQRN